MTDGRGNVGLNGGTGSDAALKAARRMAAAGVNSVMVDTGVGTSGAQAAQELARAAESQYVRLSTPDGPHISSVVRERLQGA